MGEAATHNAPFVLAKLDGRTREAKLLRDRRNELAERYGDDPGPMLRHWIETAAWFWAQIRLLDEKVAAGRALTPAEQRGHAALRDALALAERALDAQAAGRTAAEAAA